MAARTRSDTQSAFDSSPQIAKHRYSRPVVGRMFTNTVVFGPSTSLASPHLRFPYHSLGLKESGV